jgi:ATP-dependent Clp protease ATP-binding subunit ClpC
MAHPDKAHRPADDLAELPEGPALDSALGVNVTAGPSTVPDDQVYPDSGLTGTER